MSNTENLTKGLEENTKLHDMRTNYSQDQIKRKLEDTNTEIIELSCERSELEESLRGFEKRFFIGVPIFTAAAIGGYHALNALSKWSSDNSQQLMEHPTLQLFFSGVATLYAMMTAVDNALNKRKYSQAEARIEVLREERQLYKRCLDEFRH